MNTLDEHFCDNCGTPTDHLEGDSETNTCDECGHPVEPPKEVPEYDDPYIF